MISIDTNVICPGCDQKITVTYDKAGWGWYSECGGEGDGCCAAWFEKDERCTDVHDTLRDSLGEAWCSSCAKTASI